ncbi:MULTISPECIES: hypothetical protein [unclassified Streptomyces]|uniref:hypothetical protein n=1 Tax=unclassified Streptomyces TaxID=2593676 RepID=UPI0038188342
MRRTVLAVATAALAVTVTATAGCGAVDKAIDCVKTANAITDSVDKLGKAVDDGTVNRTKTDQALGDIEKDLSSLKNKTDNADLSKAVDNLNKAVDKVRTDVKKGDNTPDISGVTSAAKDIGKVCTS